MNCGLCGNDIPPGEEREHLGKAICEDCYMDTLSPVRTCDPWATHSAKSFERQAGNTGLLTSVQSEILRILEQTGGADSKVLLKKLNGKLAYKKLERELAALRHMERIGGVRKHDRIIWHIWRSS